MANWGIIYGKCVVVRSTVVTSAGQIETEMAPSRNSTGAATKLKPYTLEITQKIEQDGYEVISIWECEWKRMKKRPEIAEFLKTLKTV